MVYEKKLISETVPKMTPHRIVKICGDHFDICQTLYRNNKIFKNMATLFLILYDRTHTQREGKIFFKVKN